MSGAASEPGLTFSDDVLASVDVLFPRFPACIITNRSVVSIYHLLFHQAYAMLISFLQAPFMPFSAKSCLSLESLLLGYLQEWGYTEFYMFVLEGQVKRYHSPLIE